MIRTRGANIQPAAVAGGARSVPAEDGTAAGLHVRALWRRETGLQLHAHRVGDTLVVRLGGDFDLHSAPRFRREVDEHLRASPAVNRLVVNMEKVRFIDSSGLGALFGRLKGLQSRGGRLVAVGIHPGVRRLLELGGLLPLIDVEESEGRALRRGSRAREGERPRRP